MNTSDKKTGNRSRSLTRSPSGPLRSAAQRTSVALLAAAWAGKENAATCGRTISGLNRGLASTGNRWSPRLY